MVFLGGLISCGFSDTLDFPKDGFKIVLPQNWVQIPKEVIAEKIDNLRKTVVGSNVPMIDYAFQESSNSVWFTYPYISIEVSNAGKIPTEEIKKWTTIDFDKADLFVEQKDRGVVANSYMSPVSYDPKKKIAWQSGITDVQGAGILHSTTGIILTKKGSIRLYCYYYGKNISEVFKEIISSIVLKRQYRYSAK
jgi:hypothetical protein